MEPVQLHELMELFLCSARDVQAQASAEFTTRTEQGTGGQQNPGPYGPVVYDKLHLDHVDWSFALDLSGDAAGENLSATFAPSYPLNGYAPYSASMSIRTKWQPLAGKEGA